MNRLKEIQEKEKAPSLNVDASKRFVKSALWKAAQNKSLTETEGIKSHQEIMSLKCIPLTAYTPLSYSKMWGIQ